MPTKSAERDTKVREACDPAMGSEYTDARTYLARSRTAPAGPRRKSSEPQHGSNDSDFGIPDQKQD